LPVGKSGFTVPWAMVVTPNRSCFLRAGYTFHPAPFGTAAMHVTRHADGYEVKLDRSFRYTPQPAGDTADLIPVLRLT
jgi:hypothetical protein